MEPTLYQKEEEAEKFSLLRFALAVGLIVTMYILLFKTLLPDLWSRQFENGTKGIILVAIIFHVFNGKFEFFFHRYVLHSKVFRWLKKFYDDHTRHHALTPIFRKKPEQAENRTRIVNRYPIIKKEQYKSSFFPYWALAGFTLFFSIFTVPLQWLLPKQPILLSSFIAITFSYCLYELFHAVEHSATWENFVKTSRPGTLGRKIYGFHQFHHTNIKCNLAISGVFGLPIFDWLFKTYKQPEQLLFEGVLAREQDFSAPIPCRFIRWLDSLVEKHRPLGKPPKATQNLTVS